LPTEKLPTGLPKPGLSEDVTSCAEDIELAGRLQPLLEQEALLETFIEEAETRRKFEDVKTLKSNLDEIRREIQRVGKSAGLGASLVVKTL
jgi:rabenosyn-5